MIDGVVVFDDGVTYDAVEVEKLRGVDRPTLDLVHDIKKKFGGKVR